MPRKPRRARPGSHDPVTTRIENENEEERRKYAAAGNDERAALRAAGPLRGAHPREHRRGLRVDTFELLRSWRWFGLFSFYPSPSTWWYLAATGLRRCPTFSVCNTWFASEYRWSRVFLRITTLSSPPSKTTSGLAPHRAAPRRDAARRSAGATRVITGTCGPPTWLLHGDLIDRVRACAPSLVVLYNTTSWTLHCAHPVDMPPPPTPPPPPRETGEERKRRLLNPRTILSSPLRENGPEERRKKKCGGVRFKRRVYWPPTALGSTALDCWYLSIRTLRGLRSNIHCQVLKIYSVRHVHYRLSTVTVNIETQLESAAWRNGKVSRTCLKGTLEKVLEE